MSINVIPEYLKVYFSNEDIKPVPPSWKRPAGYDHLVSLSNSYKTEFQSIIENISRYLGIELNNFSSPLIKTSDPIELLHSTGVLDIPHVVKNSIYGCSVLFQDKEFASQFISKLNEFLKIEYNKLEPEVKIKLLLSGENIKKYDKHNVIFTSKYIAEHFKTEFKAPYFFRTLEIVEIKAESLHAIEAYIRFHTEVCGQCHLCGKALEDEFSQKTGIGPVCAKKKLGIKRTKLEDVEVVISKIKSLADEIGVVGPILIPKRHINRLK